MPANTCLLYPFICVIPYLAIISKVTLTMNCWSLLRVLVSFVSSSVIFSSTFYTVIDQVAFPFSVLGSSCLLGLLNVCYFSFCAGVRLWEIKRNVLDFLRKS